MPASHEEIYEQLDEMRRALTALQGRLSGLRTMIGTLDLPESGDRYPCGHPHCRLEFTTQTRLLEHLANVHDDEKAHAGLMELDGISRGIEPA